MAEERHDLADREADRLYEQRIRADFLEGIERSPTPTAVLVGGQPGAGRAHAAAMIRRHLAPTVGESVVICGDELREYHPDARAASVTADEADRARGPVGHWYARLTDALAQVVNVIIQSTMRQVRATLALAALLKRAGYDVSAVVLATHRDQSRQACAAAYDIARAVGISPRFVSASAHDTAYEQLRESLARLEAERAIDRLQVVAPDGRQLYANQLNGDQWLREPRAVAAFDDFRERHLTARELADSALRWQTLVQRFTSDPSVPRVVASQTITWHNEATARAEADPDAARMLQWGREAESFRAMDRDLFLREFPGHAKAVERLDEAVRYAQANFEHETDRERFVAQSRDRLAERIADGRMGVKSATREPGPRTR